MKTSSILPSNKSQVFELYLFMFNKRIVYARVFKFSDILGVWKLKNCTFQLNISKIMSATPKHTVT